MELHNAKSHLKVQRYFIFTFTALQLSFISLYVCVYLNTEKFTYATAIMPLVTVFVIEVNVEMVGGWVEKEVNVEQF